MNEQLVTVAVCIEAGVLATLVVLLVALPVARALRAGREAGPLKAAREAVFRGSELGDETTAVQAIGQLRLRRRADLLAEVAASVGGSQRNWISGLARGTGLTLWAERDCYSRRWWKRLRGVRLLTVLGGGGAAVPPLLVDGNAEVRAAAVTWVSEGPHPQLAERLLDSLADPTPLVRRAAKDALLRLGRPALAPLARALEASPSGGLDDALQVAAGLAEPSQLDPALGLVSHPSPRTRALATALVASVGGERAGNALMTVLTDAEIEVRAAAIEGLGRLGHWPAAVNIAAALRDPAWDVRRQAGLALRALGASGELLLRRALVDEDRFARDMARQVLDLPERSPRRESA